jgi:predicted DNA-binding transcriptional regulator AlpA
MTELATLDRLPEGEITDVVGELRAIRAILSDQTAELMRGKAAARFLGVSLATLYRMASANPLLRPVCVGTGCKRWRRADLQRYVSELA